MSKSSEKDYSKPYEPNLVTSKTDILVSENLSICKSGTFDAEFDLLESTLSELKDGEHESSSSKPNCNDLILIVPHSQTKKTLNNSSNDLNPQQNPELLKASCKPTSECSSCQDTCCNRPDCNHKYAFQTTQHSKSIHNQRDAVISQNNSESVFSQSGSNSGETKSEIANSCSKEAVNKTVLFVDFDQTSNISDTKECDRQPSLSLKSFEVISKIRNSSVSLDFRGKELSQAIKHSDKGCDFYTDDNQSPSNLSNKLKESNLLNSKNLHETLVSTVNNSEYSSNVAITMGDAEVGSVTTSCHLNGSNNDLTTVANSESNGSKLDSELPQSEDQCGSNEYENQEKPTESKEEECFQSLESEKATPKKQISDSGARVESQVCNEDLNDEPSKKQGIYFSTPTVPRKSQEDLNSQSSATPDFGLVSPLDIKCLKGKQNLKRKYIGLQPIEEVDEDADNNTEKKIKVDEDLDIVVDSVASSKAGTSTLPCYEAPAKSLLKKWQPSCLSRNVSATSFIVLDECGETEFDDCPKLGQENDSSRVDDFEIACQSLTEELMKSSSNIETLEKYHSQVQLENQMDDEKFDEILKELTMNVDLDDKTLLSLRSMDKSTIDGSDKTCCTLKDMEESVDTSLSGTAIKVKVENESSLSENNTTVTEGNNHISTSDDLSKGENKVDIKIEQITVPKTEKITNENAASELKSTKVKPSTSDEDGLDVDEEDFLLEENNTKDKPYEFFEFVSTDPKENEDNYNPEWQKLGRLTSDEERYKAVRDRWRSLVPPDPNRNLTYRQWRARNNKPPITVAPLNNNHQLMNDNEKNQLCTAVFENKIKKIVQELEDSRMNIYRERYRKFEELGHVQDDEQMRASMRGFNYREMALLHSNHLNQCRAVKTRYDQELKRIQDITEEKIRILREASDEVLLFQKFYKGVGARDDNDLYMTDIQVQELMETEEMLEQYRAFYDN